MSKTLIFRIMLGGLIVFLLLPAVFDEEKEKPVKSSFAEAYDFAPSGYDGDEELPVIDESSPKKDSIFTRYAKRFKKMYGRAFLGSTKQEAPIQTANTEDSDEDLYYAMAALFSTGKPEGAPERASYDKQESANSGSVNAIAYNNSAAGYLSGSSVPVKQTMHDNAPVKGLYETSSVESYETRSKAKQVYSNVMNKVDKNAPKQKVPYSASESGETVDLDDDEQASFGTDFSSSKIMTASSSSSGNKFKRSYKGISSRVPSKGGSGGSYGSYSSGSSSVPEGDSGLSRNFESAARETSGRVARAADIIQSQRENSLSSSGSSSGSNNSGEPSTGGNEGGSNSNQDIGTGGNTPGGEGEGGIGGDPLVPAPVGPENPGDPGRPVRPGRTEVRFDPMKYDLQDHGCGYFPADEKKAEKEKIDLTPVPEPETPGFLKGINRIDTGATCSAEDNIPKWVPEINDEVRSKEFIVDLGTIRKKGKTYIVTPDNSSNSYRGMIQMGLNYSIGTDDIGVEQFKGFDRGAFRTAAADKNKIILTVSLEEAARYPGRAVLIEEGSLDKKEGIKDITDKLNNLPAETQRIAQLKAERDAAARLKVKQDEAARKKAEEQDIAEKVKNVVSGTNEAASGALGQSGKK